MPKMNNFFFSRNNQSRLQAFEDFSKCMFWLSYESFFVLYNKFCHIVSFPAMTAVIIGNNLVSVFLID